MHAPYARRIALAACISLAAHAGLLALFALLPESEPMEVSAAQPTRVRFEPLPPEPPMEAPRRLVDATAEALPPERPTDLIAEVDSRAQDMAEDAGEDPVPQVDVVDEYERIAALPPAPAPQPEAPAPAPEPVEQTTPPEPPSPEQDIQEMEPIEPVEAERDPEPPASESAEPRPEPEQAERPRPEADDRPRTEIAQAPRAPEETPRPRERESQQHNPALRDPAPAAPSSDAPSPSRGRMQGAVMNKGFLGFEAMQDDIAPYLRHVQEKVERRWRLTMELEYRGAARARAVVDCAIKPNGELAFVRIHDDGGNLAYAAACANAIRSAAPFGPFPFEVPAMYRDEEIIIRWTFQFM